VARRRHPGTLPGIVLAIILTLALIGLMVQRLREEEEESE
jgi:hypothetical protein